LALELQANLQEDEGTTDPIQYFQRSLQQVAAAVALKKDPVPVPVAVLPVEVVAEARKLLPELPQAVLVTHPPHLRHKGTMEVHQQHQQLHGTDLVAADHLRPEEIAAQQEQVLAAQELHLHFLVRP
jgi:hypothetical protein